MKRFWFTGALPHSKARELSGGERRRLQLLLALATRPNVLILDEPTNDLDLETIRLIEDFLSDWPGTVVVVSHDRTFLSRTTDRLLEVRLDGTVVDIPGGIDAWIQARSEGQTPADSESGTSASNEPSRGRILRDLERDMQRLERQIQKLSERLLTITDHEEAGRRGKELTDLRFELSAAEERWLLASFE
jgi:ATP-binding cassette subfamily F protein uup